MEIVFRYAIIFAMLSEDRVKLMTKMAIFEKHSRNEYLPYTAISKKDYVGARRFVAFIIFTIIYAVCAGAIVLLMLVNLQLKPDVDALIRVGMIAVLLYVLMLFILLNMVHVMYSKRYKMGMRMVDQYKKWYDELEELYKAESADTSPKIESIDIATANIEAE